MTTQETGPSEPTGTQLTDIMLDIDDIYLELGLMNARIEQIETELMNNKDIK